MIEAALDTSYGISLAIADNGSVLFEGDAPFERRASDATLVPWVEDCFSEAGVSISSVTRWTVGVGPGSFTGLRCGIAFVKGVCLQTAAICRGLPSSLAIAAQVVDQKPDASEIAVLHDARRGQLVLTLFAADKNGQLRQSGDARIVEPAALDAMDPKTVFASIHQGQIENLLPPILRAKSCFCEKIEAVRLIFPAGWNWPAYTELEATLAPVYVRPAVFVKPRTTQISSSRI